MKPEKKAADPSVVLKAAGIREDLIPVLIKLGIVSVDAIKSSKPGKLFNEVCGMRKKMKLEDVANPTIEEIEGWIN
jgi:lysyl-tRNA synthetase class 2